MERTAYVFVCVCGGKRAGGVRYGVRGKDKAKFRLLTLSYVFQVYKTSAVKAFAPLS